MGDSGRAGLGRERREGVMDWVPGKKGERRRAGAPSCGAREGAEGALRFGVFHMVLLELTIKGGFADAENAGGGQLIAVGFTQGVENSAALELFEGQDFISFRDAL